MTVTLYLAPAAVGKTAHLTAEACRLAHNLTVTPRVFAPSRLQGPRLAPALWVCGYPPSTICGARFCRQVVTSSPT
jgi:hypothetical protein